MKKHICPKCHAVIYSSKKPKYCVCGGKYKTTQEILFDTFRDLGFGGFGDAFGGIK